MLLCLCIETILLPEQVNTKYIDRTRKIDLDHIYDATKEGKKLPSATSEKEFDLAMEIAKEKGFYGVRFSEGYKQPDSFYIIDKKIFK